MLHHAYLLLGERGEVDSHLESLLQGAEVNMVGNPDVFAIEQDVFGVDDARELGVRAIEKPFGERKVIIIHAEKFTDQAQNALLKTIEDPVANTHFFISARESGVFLPTLLSRLHVVRVSGEAEELKEVDKFLQMDIAKRIKFAKKFADEVKDTEPGEMSRGVGALAEFLDGLIMKLREEKASLDTLKKVSKLRTFARDSAAMPRIILEHLALVL